MYLTGNERYRVVISEAHTAAPVRQRAVVPPPRSDAAPLVGVRFGALQAHTARNSYGYLR